MASAWVLFAAMTAAATAGADGPPAGARLLDRLSACRTIAADAERLQCFDRAAAAVIEAQARKDIVVLDKTEVRKTKRSLFGFSLPSIKLFGDGKDDDALQQVIGTMAGAVDLAGGGLRFRLDAGTEGSSMWETTEAATVMPRNGDQVTIKAGPLGSYIATAPKRRAVKVRRIR